ncbi:hypothetical protein IEQ34_022957 [Dendrobium chrysotoxum]|uniref:Uncharacterized protein n=1 Tax=Dendrobium chrysotoxum TaxID=161865 RepID=A0AAV7FZ60_DENCH|nr:hypothetical protein IEQ34_022957 [Dendrobium chrysotoxum]
MEKFPSYCSHYKSLGHLKLDCSILHPHMLNAPTINPLSINVGEKNSIGVHESEQVNRCIDLALNENVDDASACLLGNGLFLSSDVGHSVEPEPFVFDVPVVLLVGVPVSDNIGSMDNLVGMDPHALIVNNIDILDASTLLELACSAQEACEGNNKEVANNLAQMHACNFSFVASPVVIEKAHNENAFGSHDNYVVVYMGPCDVNTTVVNDSSSGFGIASDDSPLVALEPTLSPFIMGPNENVPFIDVPITLISNDVLKAQLVIKLIDTYVDHSDCMYETFSSACGGLGKIWMTQLMSFKICIV